MLDFAVESIRTLKEFSLKDKYCSGIYLFNSMSGKILEFDSEEHFLEQNYIVSWTTNENNFSYLKIKKLSQPSVVLYELNQLLDDDK